jgi:ubiquinone/menaquinone biosynthesis C-methylase UbiE
MNRAHLEYLVSKDWERRLEADLVPWLESHAPLGDDVLEVGPGPGLTTDILRRRCPRVTAVELDKALATSLSDRLAGTNVAVIEGDAAELELPANRFSSATCFSMLHHVPTADQQDRVLGEILRVLRPGAFLLAVDAKDVALIRAGHEDDVFNPLSPDTLAQRLLGLGYCDVRLEQTEYEIRFSAHKPLPQH